MLIICHGMNAEVLDSRPGWLTVSRPERRDNLNQKKFKKIILKLAEMCNTTDCEHCFLAFDKNKCILKHASLPDIAKGYFDSEQRYDGVVWIRFDNMEEFKAARNDVIGFLKSSGDYQVKIYLKESNAQSLLPGLMADNDALDKLTGSYGKDNVKLVVEAPKTVISYF